MTNLPTVEQELARPHRLVVEAVALIVRRDVGVVKPRLPVLDLGVALPQLHFASSNRLDLSATQCQTGFHIFEDVVVVKGPAVRR